MFWPSLTVTFVVQISPNFLSLPLKNCSANQQFSPSAWFHPASAHLLPEHYQEPSLSRAAGFRCLSIDLNACTAMLVYCPVVQLSASRWFIIGFQSKPLSTHIGPLVFLVIAWPPQSHCQKANRGTLKTLILGIWHTPSLDKRPLLNWICNSSPLASICQCTKNSSPAIKVLRPFLNLCFPVTYCSGRAIPNKAYRLFAIPKAFQTLCVLVLNQPDCKMTWFSVSGS